MNDDRLEAAKSYLETVRTTLAASPEKSDSYDTFRAGMINAAVQGVLACDDFRTLDARVLMFALGTAAGSGFNDVPQEHWGLLVESLNEGLKNGIAVYAMGAQGGVN